MLMIMVHHLFFILTNAFNEWPTPPPPSQSESTGNNEMKQNQGEVAAHHYYNKLSYCCCCACRYFGPNLVWINVDSKITLYPFLAFSLILLLRLEYRQHDDPSPYCQAVHFRHTSDFTLWCATHLKREDDTLSQEGMSWWWLIIERWSSFTTPLFE